MGVLQGGSGFSDDEGGRKKQCIVVQHFNENDGKDINAPKVKNKMAVAHLYLKKPAFKRSDHHENLQEDIKGGETSNVKETEKTTQVKGQQNQEDPCSIRYETGDS